MTPGLLSRLRIAGPMLAWAALLAASPSGAQPAREAAVDLSVPRPRLESGPQAPQGIEPVSPFTPRIESRPLADGPALNAPAPPAAGADAPPLADARNADVERELQKLMRTAYAGGAYGATAASAQAAWLLGLIHLHGAGVRVDPAQAEQWFARAARQGREPWAYAGLAWCAIDSCAGPSDLMSAERAIERLRPFQPARADFLAWLLASQQKPLRAEQPFATQAQAPLVVEPQLLARAAAAGDIHANIELGIESFGEQRWDQAQKYFRRAAPRSPAASANLREVAQRVGAAAHTGTTARNDGPADATAALAQARKYHRGDGVPANFSEALRFYRLAEQRGSLEARRMVALIFSRPAPDGGLSVQWMQQLAHAETGSSIPSVGGAVNAHPLQREPTPLFDLLPAFWQKQVTQMGR